MQILLIAATRFEIEPILRRFDIIYDAGELCYQNLIGEHQLDIRISGPGVPSTIMHLHAQVVEWEYDLVINAGLAGSFNPDIPLGSIVNVIEDCFSDLGAEDDENFIPISEMNFEGPDEHILKGKSMLNKSEINLVQLLVLPKVKGITVNTIHGNEKRIERVKRIFNPDVETMEGAAVFYTCDCFGLQFIQVRAISNYVEKRDKSKWKTDEAVTNLNLMLLDLFDNLP